MSGCGYTVKRKQTDAVWKIGLYLPINFNFGEFFSSQYELSEWKKLNLGFPLSRAGHSASDAGDLTVTFLGRLHFLRLEGETGFGPSLTRGGGSWKGCERFWSSEEGCPGSLHSCVGYSWRLSGYYNFISLPIEVEAYRRMHPCLDFLWISHSSSCPAVHNLSSL